MTERIAVGDLVRVVGEPRCGCKSIVKGTIFTVVEIALRLNIACRVCGYTKKDDWAFGSYMGKIPLFRLKRIPPLSKLEGKRTEEKLKEPA